MICTLSRLTRALLVSVVALSTGVGSLPDVICCCNISSGPAGMLFASDCKGPEAKLPHEGQCSCCARKLTSKNEGGRDVLTRGRTDCQFHLEGNPEAVRPSADSVVAPVAMLDFGLATPPFVPTALSSVELCSSLEALSPPGNRGCALRQVWLI